MKTQQAVQLIQTYYPQVYLACHTRHSRKKSTQYRLSARDATLLAHLDTDVPVQQSQLAKHLGISKSTLSEALKSLERGGYLLRQPLPGKDRRGVGLLLSPKGREAISATSVLEAEKLGAALEGLSLRKLKQITQGLGLLAAACRGERT